MLMSLYYPPLGIMAYWVFGTETQEGLDWQLEKMEGAKTVCVNINAPTTTPVKIITLTFCLPF